MELYRESSVLISSHGGALDIASPTHTHSMQRKCQTLPPQDLRPLSRHRAGYCVCLIPCPL
ncbi:hypothetical protein M404DRAFT_999400, partial [Pisolithus tinctorius Marx 270]